MDKGFEAVLDKVNGIILEESSEDSFEQLKSFNSKIVMVSDVMNAYNSFKEDDFVSINGCEKCIYEGAIK